MRVLVAIPCLFLGGTEIQTLMLVRTLVEVGYEVVICCYYEYDPQMVERMELTGAKVHLLHLRRTHGFGPDTMFLLILKFLSALHVYKPDIIHVQYIAPALLPIIISRFAGIRVLFSTVHIAGAEVYGRKAKFMLRFAARLCTQFLCVSKGVEEFWFGTSKLWESDDSAVHLKNHWHHTIYNAVDVDAIIKVVARTDQDALRADLGIPLDVPLIGIVGRLTRQKGHAVLLPAMTQVIGSIPDCRLLVVGDGPEIDHLKKQAVDLHIAENILWVGAQPQQHVFQLYAIMDIVAMPSLYEGFGLTAAEAMAASKPLVATVVEGLSEVIMDGVTGLLVPAGDAERLAEALIHLLSSPDKARSMGGAGYCRVQRLYSVDRFRRSIATLYAWYARAAR